MGSSAHLAAVYLRQKAGLNSSVIQYPAAQTLLSVTSGDVACGVDTLSGLTNQQGIRVLVLTSDSGRSPLMPDVPTTKELGFPGLEVPYRIGIVGPPGIPADIVKVLEAAMAKAVADPQFQADMKKGGMGVEGPECRGFQGIQHRHPHVPPGCGSRRQEGHAIAPINARRRKPCSFRRRAGMEAGEGSGRSPRSCDLARFLRGLPCNPVPGIFFGGRS